MCPTICPLACGETINSKLRKSYSGAHLSMGPVFRARSRTLIWMTGQPHKTADKGSETAMNRFGARWIALPVFGLVTLTAEAAAQTPEARLETTRAKNDAATPAIAPVAKDRLFGSIPVSTKSDAARQFVEIALEKYENYQ